MSQIQPTDQERVMNVVRYHRSKRYTLYLTCGVCEGYPEYTSNTVWTHAHLAVSSDSIEFLRLYFKHDRFANLWENNAAPYYIVENATGQVMEVLP